MKIYFYICICIYLHAYAYLFLILSPTPKSNLACLLSVRFEFIALALAVLLPLLHHHLHNVTFSSSRHPITLCCFNTRISQTETCQWHWYRRVVVDLVYFIFSLGAITHKRNRCRNRGSNRTGRALLQNSSKLKSDSRLKHTNFA